MRIILHITDGPATNRRFWLRDQQTLSVGRTQKADYPIPEDRMISGLHFQLECNGSDCQLRDLNSTNGTFVNDQRVKEVTLADGDIIAAGQTRVAVTIEEFSPHSRPPGSPAEPAARRQDEKPPGARPEPPAPRKGSEPKPSPPKTSSPKSGAPAASRPAVRSDPLPAHLQAAAGAEPDVAVAEPEVEKPVDQPPAPPPVEERSTVGPAGFCVELYHQYLEEAAFLYVYRLELMNDPEVAWPEIDDVERRFEAQIDGLVVGADLALEICREEAGGGDPGVIHAAARVFFRHERRDLFDELVLSLDPEDADCINAVADAMRDEFPEKWYEQLNREISTAPPQMVLVASKLLSLKRFEATSDMLKASTTASQATLPQIIFTLGRLRDYQAHDPLMSFLLNHGEKDVQAASAIAMMSLGAQHMIDDSLEALANGEDWPYIPLGLGGGRGAVGALLKSIEKKPHPDCYLALGLLGDISAVNLLWAALGEDELATSAAMGLYLITGAELFEEVDVPVEEEEEEAEEPVGETGDSGESAPEPASEEAEEAPSVLSVRRISQDQRTWQGWWQRHRANFQKDKRYRSGKVYSAHVLVSMLLNELTPHRLRHFAFEELVIRYNLDFEFDTELFVFEQRKALKEIDDWVRSYGQRFDSGVWYFAGQVLD